MCFNFGAFFLRFLFQSYCLFFFFNFKFVQVLMRVLCDFLVLLISLILVCIPVILNCVWISWVFLWVCLMCVMQFFCDFVYVFICVVQYWPYQWIVQVEPFCNKGSKCIVFQKKVLSVCFVKKKVLNVGSGNTIGYLLLFFLSSNSLFCSGPFPMPVTKEYGSMTPWS